MTTARDKIAEIIIADQIQLLKDYDFNCETYNNDPDNRNYALGVADAILASLPDMIAPLVWDKHPDQHEWYNVTHMDIDGIEYGYTIAGVRSKWAVYLRFGNKRVGGLHRVPQEAFDWANTHHRAAIMAAFQTPTITP
jgi:hypothetical protein